MTARPNATRVVFTDTARCRDCYRCLRACPVKAIEMHAGQARIVAERCILCGTCIRECPQDAKAYRDDVERAARLVAQPDAVVAASVAPSFAVLWNAWERRRLAAALRQLGFRYVAETAVGAAPVAAASAAHAAAHPDRAYLCTACPAVVNYVEQYEPDALPRLTPVVSPMIAHARRIRQQLGEAAHVVFIGPCVAKKAEAERPEYAGLVSCVLTFEELQAWLARERIDIARCEESPFDDAPPHAARVFPIPGGLAHAAGLPTDVLAPDATPVSGFENLRAALARAADAPGPALVEPLFCPHGCLEGAGLPAGANLLERRARLLEFARENGVAPGAEPAAAPAPPLTPDQLAACFVARPADRAAPVSEAAIRRTLEQTGKAAPEDQLDCGACGYASCRDKAIAVIRGLAEPEMCMPRMRRLAEQRTDRIIATSPNGIVILDRQLQILSMNPAFRKMFMCSEAVLGKPISYLMDPDPFEKLAAGDNLIEGTVRHRNYNLMCHQVCYPLRDEEQYVGIFVNITPTVKNQKKLEQLRLQTQRQARELLEHQVDMAQQIARLLGEGSARGEALVKALLALAGQHPDDQGDDWLKDTYTSK